ncbi:hypothetical protein F2P79_012679 [Pimephales promelas]|nr:hypothetical protein F2P79_012679 [Pimephales promelas]
MDRFMSDRYPFTALTHQQGRENCFEVNDSHMMSNDLDERTCFHWAAWTHWREMLPLRHSNALATGEQWPSSEVVVIHCQTNASTTKNLKVELGWCECLKTVSGLSITQNFPKWKGPPYRLLGGGGKLHPFLNHIL